MILSSSPVSDPVTADVSHLFHPPFLIHAFAANNCSFKSKKRRKFRFYFSAADSFSPVNADAETSKVPSPSALEQLKTSSPCGYTKERPSIVVVGISVHTAPVEVRERLAIPESEWKQAIAELCDLNHIEEAAVLSTCNRMEIYVVALSKQRGVMEVNDWISKRSGLPVPGIRQHQFLLYDGDAAHHLFGVSAGLDSLVLGETQILAQVKQVVKSGEGVEGFGRQIGGLFKHAISVGKRVRTEIKISSGPVSVSSAAVNLAFLKLPKSSHATARVLVVGAGKMGRLIIRHLVAKGCKRVTVVNRSQERVAVLREELKDGVIVHVPLSELTRSASQADLIFTSTASETPLFFKEAVEKFPRVSDKMGGQRLFIDISVPRNVAPCVYNLEHVRVYNVDDLREVVAANKEERVRKAMEARSIIEEETTRFVAWRDSLETVPTIKKLRAYAERIRAAEVEKCVSRMGPSPPEKAVKAVEDLSHSIVNRLLHGPMQHLRCDSSRNRTLNETLENMHALNRMFSLETEISALEEKLRSKQSQL